MVLTSTRTSPYVGPVGPKSFWTPKPLSLVKKHHFSRRSNHFLMSFGWSGSILFIWFCGERYQKTWSDDGPKFSCFLMIKFPIFATIFCLRWGHHHGLVPWWRGFENPHGKCLGNHGLNPRKPIGNHRKPIGNHRKPIGNHGGFQFQFSLKAIQWPMDLGVVWKGTHFFHVAKCSRWRGTKAQLQ